MTILKAEEKPRLGYYNLEKALGAGNYAIVRLAEHCITGNKVAMKIIDKSKLCKEDVTRLFREVQIMKTLEHPNIIRLYQVIESYKYINLVTSYAQNGELYEHVMRHGKLAEHDARRYFTQICRAIRYCHRKGIVHRDLKIENVLLDCNNNVKIADFGFSNYFKPTRLLETFCGSPQYAAPEIFSGKCYDGNKVDIWSLGIILYVLVTGGLPFDGENLADVKKSVLTGKFRIPYYISYECESLIRSMLTMDPAKRSNMGNIFSHSWMQHDDNQDLDPPRSGCTNLNDNILNLMQNIGISKCSVLNSYNSFRFDDFTAIYKLLYDQLQTNGSIDTTPIKRWLRQELPTTHSTKGSTDPCSKSTTPTSCTDPDKPAQPQAHKISTKKCSSKQGLDKVLHNAKNRALSAIFHKNTANSNNNTAPSDDTCKTKAKHKDNISKGAKSGGGGGGPVSPLVSSLISPRTVLSDSSASPKFFQRTVFAFSNRKTHSRNHISGNHISDQQCHTAR